MKPELILKADILDLLFENRNKAYGAYELRKNYNERLLKSLTIMIALLLAVFFAMIFKDKFSSNHSNISTLLVGDTVMITPLSNKPLPKPIPLPHHVATVQDVTIRIVPPEQADQPIPTQEDIDHAQISTTTTPGEVPGDIEQPTSTGTNTETAPVQAVQEETNKIVDIAEIMPEYPGGLSALNRFLSRNLRVPKDDLAPGTRVKVVAKFVVDKDGTISGIEFIQSGGQPFDEEVMRVMKKMPVWKPGSQNGQHVAVYFNIPFIFQVPDDN